MWALKPYTTVDTRHGSRRELKIAWAYSRYIAARLNVNVKRKIFSSIFRPTRNFLELYLELYSLKTLQLAVNVFWGLYSLLRKNRLVLPQSLQQLLIAI